MPKIVPVFPASDTAARVRWLVDIRWLFLILLIVPGQALLYVADGAGGQRFLLGVVLSVAALVSNGLFYNLSHRQLSERRYRQLAVLIIGFDVLMATVLLMFNGGLTSRTTILYTMPILVSAAVLGRPTVYYTALGSVLGYAAVVLADFFGVVDVHPLNANDYAANFSFVFTSAVYIGIILLIVAISADYLIGLLIERERRAEEVIARLKQAQVIAAIGNWTYDDKMKILSGSNEFVKMLGHKPLGHAVALEWLMERMLPQDRAVFMRSLYGLIKKSKAMEVVFRINSPDGTRHIRMMAQCGEGKLSGTIVGVSRDITNSQLLEEMKNEFVALASHQLRTPATVVKQYLSMLLDGFVGDLNGKQQQMLSVALAHNDRQIRIVNDLLSVAQIDSGGLKLEMSDADLVALIWQLVEASTPRLRAKEQTVSIKMRYKRMICRVDERRLEMALSNIIDNSIKFSPAHSVITIKLTRKGRRSVISISDKGMGIDQTDIPKLFNKFSRLKATSALVEEGVGLGLYWAHKIISLHRGRIDVESAPKQGSTFKITLPIKVQSRLRSKKTTIRKSIEPIDAAIPASA